MLRNLSVFTTLFLLVNQGVIYMVKFIKDWVIPLIIAVVLAAAINYLLVFKIRVPTESMVPAILPKDQIFVTRTHSWTKLNREEVIVFQSDELKEVLVKRLIGLPGDTVEFKDGFIKINGVKLNDHYVENRDDYNGTFKVPADSYFFVGDNRPVSLDARYWKNKFIPRSKIMGKAVLRVFPFDRIGIIK
jgi:signal peptidase I